MMEITGSLSRSLDDFELAMNAKVQFPYPASDHILNTIANRVNEGGTPHEYIDDSVMDKMGR